MDEFEKIDLVENPKFYEKIIAGLVKTLGFGFGSIPMWPHVIIHGLKPNSSARSMQSKSYVEGDCIVYRSKGKPVDGYKSFQTIPQVFFSSAKNFPNRRCLGRREVHEKIEVICELTKKPIIKYWLGEFQWKTYSDVSKDILAISKTLIDLGLNETNKMALFCNTSPDWLTMALTLMNISSPLVTIYPTLSDEAVVHAITLSEAVVIMVDEKTLPRFLRLIDCAPLVKHLIVSRYIDDYHAMHLDMKTDINILDFEKLLTSDSKTDSCSRQPSDSDSLASIMFTSGSSGVPKGVMLSHRNFLSTIGAVVESKRFKNPDVYSAFLPSSHVFELAFEFGMLANSSALGYCTPYTIFDTSPMIKEGTKGDLTLLKPTIVIAVPLLLERVKKAILDKLKLSSRIKRIIFQVCYHMKMTYRSYGFETPLMDRIVFKPFRQIFGGNVSIGFIGGAYISKNTEEFFNICCGRFKQGYGLTETTSGITLIDSEYYPTGSVGPPLAHCEIKLLPWAEGNYDPRDKNNPSGEIAISGPCLAIGYYNNEEQNKASFIIDKNTGKRWFLTGDIGSITPDGCLKIIDRKKDIIKLLNGEYVSLVKIESKIGECPLIDLTCVLPSKSMEYLVALIIPNRDKTKKFLIQQNSASDQDDMDTILSNSNALSLISDHIKLSVKSELSKQELPRDFIILPDIWTPEGNLVTPTMKLKRSEIASYYRKYLT